MKKLFISVLRSASPLGLLLLSKTHCVFFTLLALAGLGLRAQQVDTIHWGDPNYFWDPFLCPDTVDLGDYNYTIGYTPGESFDYYHCDGYAYKRFIAPKGGLTMLGLAVPTRSGVPGGHGLNSWVYPNLNMHLKVFQGQNPGVMLDSICINRANMRSLFDGSRRFEYTYTDSRFDIDGRELIEGHWVDTLWEIRFSEPLYVHDTFWVGFNNYRLNNPHGQIGALVEVAYADTWVAVAAEQTEWWEGYDGPDDPAHWDYWQLASGHMWLPIIRPIEDTIDFSCETPQSPQLGQYEGSFATLSWQRPASSLGLELAFGPDTLDPDLFTPITLSPSQTTHDLHNLTPGHFYAAWLRNLCRHHCYYHDTSWYSPWSDPLRFYLPVMRDNDTTWLSDTTCVVGGSVITLGDNLIEIDGQPYVIVGADTIPCDDPRLTWIDDTHFILDGQVTSGTRASIHTPDTPAAILRQEYYDLLGRRLAQPPARGLYLLRTITTNGTTTRKIIKQ